MELLNIGKISGTHHLKGAVKIIANIENPEVLVGNKVIIELGENNNQILTIEKISKLLENRWIVEFKEITNKTEAGKLSNAFIKVRRDLLNIADDEYLINDLIQMEVIDFETGEKLGTVTDIFETPAHDILVIDSLKYEIMLPNIEEFIKKINFDDRKIYAQLIEGLKTEKGKKFKQDDGLEDSKEKRQKNEN